MIEISILNASTVVTDADASKVVEALQVQVNRDFFPAWGINADVDFIPKGQPPISGSWQLVILDNSDMAGALGYHDVTKAGMPIGKIFAKTDLDNGLSWSVTASHELCLAEDTIIPLADGSNPTIETISKRGGLSARRTGKNKPTCRVIFSDGSSVRCTDGHSFLKLSGDFVPAKNLFPGDVLPTYTRFDGVNSAGTYSVPLCDRGVSVGTIVNRKHVRSRKLGVPDAFSHCLSSLGIHIGLVVGIGTKKQMFRIDAVPHVAMMANIQSNRDVSKRPFIAEAMGIEQLTSKSNHSIAALRNTSCPNPTFVGFAFDDFRPKSLFKGGPSSVEQRIDGIGGAGVVHSSPMSSAQSFRPERSDASGHRARFDSLCNRHTQIVHKIEKDDKCDVYDLTIPDRHNFAVQNGVFVHNCEMLADPAINLTVFREELGQLYSYEVADAPEADDNGYDINGVLVSDFVFPSWFESFWTPGSTQFDQQKKINAPFQLLPGGYAGIFDIKGGNGWQQITAQHSDKKYAAKARPPVGSRRDRRRTARKDWMKSER